MMLVEAWMIDKGSSKPHPMLFRFSSETLENVKA